MRLLTSRFTGREKLKRFSRDRGSASPHLSIPVSGYVDPCMGRFKGNGNAIKGAQGAQSVWSKQNRSIQRLKSYDLFLSPPCEGCAEQENRREDVFSPLCLTVNKGLEHKLPRLAQS
jgi:hypothetical protein